MARSVADLEQMGIVDSSLERALRVRPFPEMPHDVLEHREARAAHLRTLRHLMPVPGPIPKLVAEQTLFVPARDDHQIRVIHYAPTTKPASPPPLIVLFHEGGYRMGDLSDEEFNARILTRDLGAVCLNVEYRLAPEHLFPTSINDCWDVVCWAAKSADVLGVDLRKGFVVGGSSAGGNASAIVAHLSRNTGLQPPITGQWLSVPFLIPASAVPEKYMPEYLSPTQSPNDPVLTWKPDGLAERASLGVLKADASSPLFSAVAPGNYPPADSKQISKGALAKAFIQVAGLDPLRDHGLVYDRILRLEYSTDTRVEIYPGVGHMFWTNWPELDMSKKFTKDMIEGFGWLLGKPQG